jgi:hypothetical protein
MSGRFSTIEVAMPEANVNAEIAKHLSEHGDHGGGKEKSRFHLETVEILEAILLALVAVVTAWGGYQAAKWDGVSSRDYATSSRLRAEGNERQLTSNQYLLYNSGNLDSWLQATTSGQKQLASILERRFTPDYKVAFDAWLKTHPLTNASAPVGPRFMPEYKDPLAEQAKELNAQATEAFTAGVESRDRAEHYVRVTVLLAAVLFLIALGQRFTFRVVRFSMLGVAGVFLVYTVILLLTYPRA